MASSRSAAPPAQPSPHPPEVGIDHVEGLGVEGGPVVGAPRAEAGAAAGQQGHEDDVRLRQQVLERVQRLEHPAHTRSGRRGQPTHNKLGMRSCSSRVATDSKQTVQQRRCIVAQEASRPPACLRVTPGTARTTASSACQMLGASASAAPRSFVPMSSTATCVCVEGQGGE